VADWQATDKLTPLEKLVCEFAEAASLTPVAVTDDLRARLKAEFTDKQLTELAHLIAWENARARFNRTFDIAPEGYAAQTVDE